MMRSEDLTFRGVTFTGKYSFQYIKNATFENCVFDTKDAFWHGENNLKLIHCEMVDTDLAFEKSEVEATVTTEVISIKNPLSGCIIVPAVGEIIRDDENAKGEIVISHDRLQNGKTCACA